MTFNKKVFILWCRLQFWQGLAGISLAALMFGSCAVVALLCFQGRSQLEAIYGHQAEVMFSQPSTKILLKTSEPRAAPWISDTLGETETKADTDEEAEQTTFFK